MIQQIRDSLDGLYLYPSEKVKIHINPAGGYLVNEGWNKYSEWTLVHISPLERDILLASDGGHRIEDVVNTIGYPLNEAYPEIECRGF